MLIKKWGTRWRTIKQQIYRIIPQVILLSYLQPQRGFLCRTTELQSLIDYYCLQTATPTALANQLRSINTAMTSLRSLP